MARVFRAMGPNQGAELNRVPGLVGGFFGTEMTEGNGEMGNFC